MKILGISAFYHDSAAALIDTGVVLAAAQEERFTEIKNDANFPILSISYCLTHANLKASDLDAIVFYEKPFLKFERILESYIDTAPKSWISFVKNIPIWLTQKVFQKSLIKKELKKLDPNINWEKTQLLFSNHHLSHAASAFFASPFEEAAILTIDGVGEWATASIAHGNANTLLPLKEMQYPHSLGLLYSAFTYYLGFEVNSGEYKVMGLAPYANEQDDLVQKYVTCIKENVVTLNKDGSIELNQTYFKYNTALRMTNDVPLEKLLGLKRREKKEDINAKHCALAQALQLILEEAVLNMATYAKAITGAKNLCLAGGVALNGVANGKIQEANLFEQVYIQPAAGDAGAALGAAWAAYHLHYKKNRQICLPDAMHGALLGPNYTGKQITQAILEAQLNYQHLSAELLEEAVIKRLLDGKVIGWFEGRMEFGPRALGARSIIANPLLPEMQSKLNQMVKKRESFRPFAPILLKEEFEKLFGQKHHSPYMLMVHKILNVYRTHEASTHSDIIQIINQKRSPLPAITHVDFSSRIQTINENSNPGIRNILQAFKKATGYGVLINTSFNINNMPIVCSPKQAILCFKITDIDCLILDGYLIDK